MPDGMTEQKGLFQTLSPKSAFWVGVITSLAVVFTAGFFVMLVMFFKSDGTGSGTAAVLTNTSGAVAGANANTAAANIAVKPVTTADWRRGNDKAKVTVIEYSDLECPFCKQFHPTVAQLMTEYGDKINWVYRHFPLASLHPKAPKEAEAAECAGELGGQDAFWKFIDRVFEVTPGNNGLDPAQLPEIAVAAGVNKQKFQDCYNSGKYASKIQAAVSDAEAAGGQGTPYSVIIAGGKNYPVSGAVPYSQLKSIVDSALAGS